MKSFTVYSRESGQILRCGQCQPIAFEIQAADGEAVIEGRFPDDAFYIVDDQPVAIPAAPNTWVQFDHATGAWVDRRDITELKANASAAVVAWAEQFLDQFTAGYPRQETLAWGAKLAAARRVIAGEHDALIAVEAEALGVHVLTLALRVNVLGSRYEQIVALTSAIRGATQARIAAAPDAAALPAILEDAKATAEAALARITAGQ